MGIKIWLDDERNPPDNTWLHTKHVYQAWHFIKNGIVNEISFDHDLGEREVTGNSLAKRIEEYLFLNELPRIIWHVHSQNPVGRQNIISTMQSCDRMWDRMEQDQNTINFETFDIT